MGFIYIIKNYITDKVYIGQTINTVEYRYNQHLWLASRGTSNSKLYLAMMEIGLDNFYVETLLECDNSELNKHEQYYVEKYDSLDNGYNSVYPCSSTGKRPVHDYEDKVIDLYLSGYSFARIAKETNISTQHANSIIIKHEVHRYSYKTVHTTEMKTVVMYTKEFEPICKFESIAKAFEWLVNNSQFRVTEYGAYAFIDVACQNGNIAYGHRWQLLSDLVYDNKTFRTKFDKEDYIQGKPAYQPEGKKYYIVDGSLNKVKTFRQKSFCVDCGKELLDKRNTRCINCANNAKKIINIENGTYKFICKQCRRNVSYINVDGLCSSCYNVIAKGKSPKPSKEELQALLASGLQKKQIAKMYGRTDSTIHYWIKSYGL